MWWWSILKSSRDEAYSKFLEEFGPGVELESLEFKEFAQGVPQLIGGDWTITLIVDELYIHSIKYENREFVQGMFEEEYPERYKEIEDLLEHLLELERERKGIITSSKELPFSRIAGGERWLKNHMFFLDARLPTRNEKLAILINIIGYYRKKNGYGEEDILLELYDIKEQFEDTNNLFSLFQRYLEVMDRHGYVIEAREILTTSQQIKILHRLLNGRIPMPSNKRLTIGRVD